MARLIIIQTENEFFHFYLIPISFAAWFAGSMGGDEFAVILPQTDYDEAETLVNRIVKSVRNIEMKNRDIRVSISAGFITFRNEMPDMVTAVKAADDMMYAVKHAGKNNAGGKVYRKYSIS